MRDIAKAASKSTIQESLVDLRCIYLPVDFITEFKLKYKTKYQILIDDANSSKTAGTLQVTNVIGGLAKMYRAYDLQVGDEVGLDCENGTIIVIPPQNRLKVLSEAAATSPLPAAVPAKSRNWQSRRTRKMTTRKPCSRARTCDMFTFQSLPRRI